MANLDFYAIEKDVSNILEFVFSKTDCKIFESYSEYEKDLREFKSVAEIIETYNSQKTGLFLLQLWSPSVSANVFVERIILDPKKCNAATYRFRINGWGLIQLYFGGVQNGGIDSSHFGHNNEKRARNWESTYFDELGLVDEWDWKLLKNISEKIQYHIRKRLAVSKVSSRPILESAFKKYSEGFRFKHFTIEDKL